MKIGCRKIRRGYTVVELLVTVLIVAVLSMAMGGGVLKLLSLQEREREEGFIREKLVDVCGAYADFLSVGSFVAMSNGVMVVKYRQEAGGISLETGVVTHVSHLTSALGSTNRTVNVEIFSSEKGNVGCALDRTMNGNAALIPLVGDIVGVRFIPLNSIIEEKEGMLSSDAVLGYLEATARYRVRNDDGEVEERTATAGRVVRLWNRE